jgi:hypothetical protein
MSSLNSVSNIGVSSTKADKPSDEKARPLDGSEQSFGELFGRVFGASSERQALAAQDGQDHSPSLRAVFIGSETQVITAGQPPTEEEILSFAREANLDETSVQALLLTIPGGPIAGVVGAAESNIDEALLGQGQDKANQLSGGNRSVSGLFAQAGAGLISGEAQDGVQLAAKFESTELLTQGKGQVTEPLLQGKGQVTELLTQGKEQIVKGLAGASGSSGIFSVSVKPVGLERQVSGQSALAVLASRAESEVGEGPEEILAGRLGLSPKDFSKKQLFEGLLNKAALNEALVKSSPHVQLESIDLSGLDLGDLEALKDRTPQTTDEPPSLSSGLQSSFDTGGRSSSGSGEGSSGRPDQLAQQPGRALSQQVLQRFGELLGQRLLQQIGQGNWKVEMALEPADLGSIQIELEWRKGELEASFKASQATTRELLQEGLPRLREVLERAGIDVASVYVSDHGRQQSFQGRSGRGSADNGLQSRQSDPVNEVDAEKTGPKIGTLENGRLDVLV